MAQLDFYFNKVEKKEFLEYLVSKNCKFVTDKDCISNSYLEFDKIEELTPFLDGNVIFFILHESYTKFPLEMRTFMKNNEEKHYVSQRDGGPTIHSYLNGLAEESGKFAVNFISMYPYYFINGEKTQTPIELINFYKIVEKYIKSKSKAYKYIKRSVWIGNDNDQEYVASQLYK